MHEQVVNECVAKLTESPESARRLFHGRGHCYPGYEHLVVNWFPPHLHIASYLRDPTITQQQEVDAFIAGLVHQLESTGLLDGVVVQQRDGRATHSFVERGEVPAEILVQEHGLNYWIQPTRNQNTGLFLDMGHIRSWLADRVAGKRVLNLFAYTCAFSVSAIANGAALVVNNDMSKNALAWGTRNHEANQQDLRNVRMIGHNLFKSWWKVKQYGPYDVVIIDPPTNQRGSFVAEKSYGQVLKRLPELCAPGAIVLACLNSPFLDEDFVRQQMQKWCDGCRFEQRFGLHPDFPDKYPERALKVMQFTYAP